MKGQKGISVGAGGTIIFSHDGGATWSLCEKGIPPLYWLSSIKFKEEAKAIAVGKWGIIAETKDGGKTWEVKK
jgi:photosystem II stability/assembly factor-like uncharacterized protein